MGRRTMAILQELRVEMIEFSFIAGRNGMHIESDSDTPFSYIIHIRAREWVEMEL